MLCREIANPEDSPLVQTLQPAARPLAPCRVCDCVGLPVLQVRTRIGEAVAADCSRFSAYVEPEGGGDPVLRRYVKRTTTSTRKYWQNNADPTPDSVVKTCTITTIESRDPEDKAAAVCGEETTESDEEDCVPPEEYDYVTNEETDVVYDIEVVDADLCAAAGSAAVTWGDWSAWENHRLGASYSSISVDVGEKTRYPGYMAVVEAQVRVLLKPLVLAYAVWGSRYEGEVQTILGTPLEIEHFLLTPEDPEPLTLEVPNPSCTDFNRTESWFGRILCATLPHYMGGWTPAP